MELRDYGDDGLGVQEEFLMIVESAEHREIRQDKTNITCDASLTIEHCPKVSVSEMSNIFK